MLNVLCVQINLLSVAARTRASQFYLHNFLWERNYRKKYFLLGSISTKECVLNIFQISHISKVIEGVKGKWLKLLWAGLFFQSRRREVPFIHAIELSEKRVNEVPIIRDIFHLSGVESQERSLIWDKCLLLRWNKLPIQHGVYEIINCIIDEIRSEVSLEKPSWEELFIVREPGWAVQLEHCPSSSV